MTAIDKEWFTSPVVTLASSLQSPLAESARAFAANLGAVVEVATLPLTFATQRAFALRLQQLHMAERIRRLPTTPDSDALAPEDERDALATARETFTKELTDPQTFRHVALDTYRHLAGSLDGDNARVAARELLRQSAVLLWGSFEVLCRDVFVATLNAKPHLVSAVASQPSTKARFSLKSIDLANVVSSDFDLRRSMGDLLIADADLSDLALIKDAFGVLLPAADALRALFADRDLWTLYQRRHLIVHRRGVVDRQYLSQTGEPLSVGTELVVRRGELRSYLLLIRNAGERLLVEAAAL